MVDHNAAANKQVDSMTDKVADREVAGADSAAQNLQSDAGDQPAFLIPDKEDLEKLQKNFGASRFQVIENFTKGEGSFENTVKGLLRTF